jgi:ribose transport system substrate-binding protein
MMTVIYRHISARAPFAKGHWSFLALLLAVCAAPAALAKEFVVAFAQDTLANDWRAAQVEDVRRELLKHPHIKFIVADAEGDTALQIMQIEDLVAAGVDVLITSPREEKLLTPVISRVHRNGTPVILLSRGIQGDSYTSFVRPDNLPIARAAGQLIVEALNGKGTVLMLEGVPGASTTILRNQGFLEVIHRQPNIRVIRHAANYLRADAIRVVEEVLRAGVSFDAIYAQSDSMATGARLALGLAGIAPGSIAIVGIDYIHEARDAIRRGEQLASFTYATGGKEGARLALDLLSGKPVPKSVVLESVKVTKDNVEQIAPIF